MSIYFASFVFFTNGTMFRAMSTIQIQLLLFSVAYFGHQKQYLVTEKPAKSLRDLPLQLGSRSCYEPSGLLSLAP